MQGTWFFSALSLEIDKNNITFVLSFKLYLIGYFSIGSYTEGFALEIDIW